MQTYETRGRLVIRIFSILGAVLLVGIIISTVCFLSVNRIDPMLFSWPNQATSSEDGLTMSLGITPGPYFLSEMLTVDISLRNETQKPVFVGAPFVLGYCELPGNADIVGGGKPEYEVPISTTTFCPHYVVRGYAKVLEPGRSFDLHTHLLLTKSGKQTVLTRAIMFRFPSTDPHFVAGDTISSPLDDHWPKIEITVNPNIPRERQLTFNTNSSQIIVQNPLGSHILYLYGYACGAIDGFGESGNITWKELSSSRIDRPNCSSTKMRWDFAIAVPGYAVLTGTRVFA